MCSANCPPRVLARAQSAVSSLPFCLAGKTTCSPINQSHALCRSPFRATRDTRYHTEDDKTAFIGKDGRQLSPFNGSLGTILSSIIRAGFIASSKRNCFSMSSSLALLLLSLPCSLENNGGATPATLSGRERCDKCTAAGDFDAGIARNGRRADENWTAQGSLL